MSTLRAAADTVWCRHCDERVTVKVNGLAFHTGSRAEKCADGEHVAAPIGFRLAAWA